MPKRTWRDKPGAAESCKVLAESGGQLCPRHRFLDDLRQREKEAKRELKVSAIEAGVTGHLPLTRAELIRKGYVHTGRSDCGGCGKAIEWWRTPNGKSAPFDPMPHTESFAKSHFSTCTKAKTFRRAS